jgi:hypothetical protein
LIRFGVGYDADGRCRRDIAATRKHRRDAEGSFMGLEETRKLCTSGGRRAPGAGGRHVALVSGRVMSGIDASIR